MEYRGRRRAAADDRAGHHYPRRLCRDAVPTLPTRRMRCHRKHLVGWIENKKGGDV
jgi:hypothetical protein